MGMTYGEERGRALGAAYLLFIACVTVPLTIFRALHPNGWTPGDWLVNYEGGFVRRGLPGEVLLELAHGLHLSPVLLGSLLPLLFYVLLYWVIWQLYRRSSGDLWTFAALVSPATLAFPILDPTGAFRKELILLLALGVLLLWLARSSETRSSMASSSMARSSVAKSAVNDGPLTLYLTLVGPLAILSHEGLLPYLVYLIGALWIALGDPRRVLKVAGLPLLATAGTLLLVLRHRGNLMAEQKICSSLGTAPPIVCSGSIAYLANGTDVARADVLRNIHAYHYLVYYPFLALLALVPLVAMGRELARNRQQRPGVTIVVITTFVALLASLPLFLYAMDWGRWIYIHVVSIFLLLLFLDVRAQATQEVAPAPAPLRAPPRWASLGLLVYATCWNIPHFGNYPKKGYWNVPLHLLKEEMDHRHGRHAA